MDSRYVQLVEVDTCHNQNVAAHKGLYADFCRLIVSCVTVRWTTGRRMSQKLAQ